MNILSLNQVSHAFGGPKLLDKASLQIESGDRICLLGRNGTGKSTLLHLLNNDSPPDSGEIIRMQGITTAYVPQEFPESWAGEVRHTLQQILATQGIEPHLANISIEQTLSQLDLDPEAELSTLSGGLKRRALLATALVQDPDLLLLDEPTNHLDITAICWLENFLQRLRKTLIFISHDRTFARNLANRIIELDRGQLQDYRCNYATYLERRLDVLHSEDKAWARLDQKLAEEEVWIRKGIKARRTRNMGRVRELQKLREDRRDRRDRTGQVRLQLESGQRSGQMVLETEQLSFSYDNNRVIDSLDLRIMRGDRIGLIGPNGSGKTTLLKILTEELQPTAGNLRHGTNLQIAYFDQLREQLDEDRSVKQNIADDHDQVMINGNPRHIYGYLQDFLFTPERARTPVRVLSGGEKNRLLLAKLFTQPANLLILDEPTNDLDMETLDLLEELLLDYQGTVLLVSHDRSFLNNVVTSSLIFDGKGNVDEVIGGYDDWLATQAAPETPAKKEKRKPVQRKERPRKMSFKEKKELEYLPEKIESLETEQTLLHEKMASPAIYKEGGSSLIATLKNRLHAVETELEEAYRRWDELDQIPD
ncbi:MAG: ATP-binding cassette domain-containing protein [Desulfuromusa sp.]|jgi:ATP-binding cassette subfamily F protein uup|nr:ATP-binding cassette domain-containing protein [Desulfuromusa sp.]